MAAKPFGHAAVVGSGIAGLVAARVLSDFFEGVTLIEKDVVSRSPEFRRGTPQGRHFHGLLPGGLRILRELLPGVAEDLRAAGSLLPAPHELYYFRPEGKSFRQTTYMPEPPADAGERKMYVQTRALLEHCVRTHVEALANVTVRYETRVKEVVSSDRRVTGVALDGTDEILAADLVVDATGQSCNSLQWLDRLGFERPKQEVVNCDFAYTTVFMRPENPDIFTDVGFLVLPDPGAEHQSRGGGLMRVENGLWMVAAGGRYGDFPPRDFAGFLEFLESLHHPQLHQLARQAELVGDPAHYRLPRSLRRRFDKLEAFPEGLLPIGDSICHYNPAYGHGMAAACRQAKALQTALSQAVEHGLPGLWRSFFPEAFQETRAPWLFAALGDFRDSRCTGDFPVAEMHLLNAMQRLAAESAKGDGEAKQIFEAIGTLETRIDVLEQPPWRERFAASTRT